MNSRSLYGEDLAHAHSQGFAMYWDGAAEWLAGLACAADVAPFVVDIGCGDGRMLAELGRQGVKGRGFDVSEPLVNAARARGLVADVGDAKILEVPPATLVIALGEVLVYQDSSGEIALEHIVDSAADSLAPGGALVFDVTSPEMVDSIGWRDEGDWMVASQTTVIDGDHLERRNVVFRRDGNAWRRNDETHYQKLLDSQTVEAVLVKSGLTVEHISSLGETTLLPGRQAYLAGKQA